MELCRLGAFIGISAMMLIGAKEVAYVVTSQRLGNVYDDYRLYDGFHRLHADAQTSTSPAERFVRKAEVFGIRFA